MSDLEIKITPEKITKILQVNLRLEEFFYLWELHNKIDTNTELLFCDIVDLMGKGWFYSDYSLSTKAKELIADIERDDSIISKLKKKKEVKVPSIDYSIIHKSLEDKLLSAYGKKQVEGFGGVYFKPSVSELKEFLERFWKHYPEATNIVKIEKCLLSHIEKCSKSGKFAPAIKYFIIKKTDTAWVSQLIGAYDNFEEAAEEVKEIKVTNTKELF